MTATFRDLVQVVGAFPAQSNTLSEAELGLVEALPQPILCCHIDGTLLYMNTAAAKLLDCDLATLSPLVADILADAPQQQPFTWRMTMPGGDPLYLQVSPALLADAFANPRLLLLTLQDLSAQQRAEAIQQRNETLEARVAERTAEAQRARHRVEAILNHSSDAILLARPNGAIQQTNYAFSQMFGYIADEAYGLPFVSCADHPYSEALAATLREVVERAQPGRIEIVARRRSGETFDADVSVSPLLSSPGQVANLVCSLRDISDRKQLERDLRAALIKERTHNEIRARFIARVSHEFRTPLATIRTASEMLERYYDRMTQAQRDEKLSRVKEGVERITAMLDKLLYLDNAGDSHNAFQPQAVNLQVLSREQIARLRDADKNQHPIRFSCEGDCTEVWLDPELITQIIAHLLSNAARYSPAGSPIEFSLSCQLANTVICIQDYGIGIPSVDHPYLFEPFHRAQNVQDTEGAGLGLSVVRQAVEMQGGTIHFESQLGKGSTFTVTIPAISEREAR